MGQYDEMDFILQWNADLSEVKQIDGFNFEITHPAPYDQLFESNIKVCLWKAITTILANIQESLVEIGLIIDTFSIHNKAPGLFLRLQWTCNCTPRHTNTVSLDLTPTLLLKEKTLGDYWTLQREIPRGVTHKMVEQLKSAPVALVPRWGDVRDEPGNQTGHVTSPWELSLNVCDYKIFQLLAEENQNICVLYRLLKVFRDVLFPQEIALTTPNEKFDRTLKYKQLISSYQLESILLEEVEQHSGIPEKWDNNSLKDRLISCLTRIKKNRYRSLLTNEWDHILKIDGHHTKEMRNLHNHVVKIIECTIKTLNSRGLSVLNKDGENTERKSLECIYLLHLNKDTIKMEAFRGDTEALQRRVPVYVHDVKNVPCYVRKSGLLRTLHNRLLDMCQAASSE